MSGAMLRYCVRCRTTHPQNGRCPRRRPKNAAWSPNRDAASHARFRRAVLARAGGRCEICGSDQDVRATHVKPLREGGTDDPSNGRALCRDHDLATDPYAR